MDIGTDCIESKTQDNYEYRMIFVKGGEEEYGPHLWHCPLNNRHPSFIVYGCMCSFVYRCSIRACQERLSGPDIDFLFGFPLCKDCRHDPVRSSNVEFWHVHWNDLRFIGSSFLSIPRFYDVWNPDPPHFV